MRFLKKLLLHVGIGVLGFFLAERFIPGVEIKTTEIIFYAGLFLGIINYFVRPFLRIIALPLRIITLGFFSFLINIAMVWVVQAAFREISIDLFLPLIYTTLIIWVLEISLYPFVVKK